MKRMFFISVFGLSVSGSFGQTIGMELKKAFRQFENDIQLKHAVSSLYVIDAKTGAVVFGKNEQTGLAPASTQKIITSVTAFELLKKDFSYKTTMGYQGNIIGDSLSGAIVLRSEGDPTLGSWRYASTLPERILRSLTDSLKKAGIRKMPDSFFLDDRDYDEAIIPDGWIWQDMGNYYGAGPAALNWRENQYDLTLRSGNKVNDRVDIVSDNSAMGYDHTFSNQLTSAARGSGDNAYIYLPGEGGRYLLKGTIPAGENNFKISGSIANPPDFFINSLREYLRKEKLLSYPEGKKIHLLPQPVEAFSVLGTHHSPSLDSIVYWFLKKSINLYGEALLRTLAYQESMRRDAGDGIAVIKGFWKQKGLDEEELNIMDGSGLSPQNRVTTHAQVEILKYAKTRDWFPYFYDALPEYNGMKMKSGTIGDVKGFCGYHKAKNGREYIFSFLVNNYSGASSALVKKMYEVLNKLK